METTALTYSFPENTVEAFQKVVKWMYGGSISIGNSDKTFLHVEEGAKEIDMAIEFFALADEMNLLGSKS